MCSSDLAQVDDGTALSVHAHRLGEDAGCVVGLRVVVHAEEIVLAFEVALPILFYPLKEE